MTTRLVVLVSGGGTNLQAVMDACITGILDAEVVAVVSNRPEAYGLERARIGGVPGLVCQQNQTTSGSQDRVAYDTELAELVQEHEPDLVVLAGWMRILSSLFLSRFRVLNLHPALPGQYPGIRAIERAFSDWETGEIQESGVMVHWVPDEGVDDGPVIVQTAVPFNKRDTLEAFEARLHAVEHELLVRGIGLVIPIEKHASSRT